MSVKGILLKVNGQDYTGFTQASVSRSFIQASGQYSFTATPLDTSKEIDGKYPIQMGDTCEITVEDQTFLTGYVEDIAIDRTADTYEIIITGRDVTAPLIDSTIDSSVLSASTGNTTLEDICKIVISKIQIPNLGVVNNVTDSDANTAFSEGEIVAAMPAQNAFEYVQQYAHFKQTILSTDGLGNLTINRTGTFQVPNPLLSETNGKFNNIVKTSSKASIKNQFNFYKVYSQKALMSFEFQGTKFADGSTDLQNQTVIQQGSSTNNAILKGRQLIFIAETPLNGTNQNTAKDYADWENNYRQTQGFNYQVTVSEHTYDGVNIWQPNTLVSVKDDYSFSKVLDSILLIDTVTFNEDLINGRTTVLNLVWKNAYSLIITQNYREANANVVQNPYGLFFNIGLTSG